MARDVFISYTSDDREVADAVCSALEQQGIRCWLARRDASLGTPFSRQIDEAIDGAKATVLILSSRSNNSNDSLNEVRRAAKDGGKPVVTFKIEGLEPNDELNQYLSPEYVLDASQRATRTFLGKLAGLVHDLVSGDEATVVEPSTEREETEPPPQNQPEPAKGTRIAIHDLVSGNEAAVVEPSTEREETEPPPQNHPESAKRPRIATASAIAILVVIAITSGWLFFLPLGSSMVVTVAGKNFLESSILVEMMAAVIESDNPDIDVVRRHYAGNSGELFQRLQLGDIQIYPEYSGTLLIEHLLEDPAVAHDEANHEPAMLNRIMEEKGLLTRFVSRFGLNNSYQMVTSAALVEEMGIEAENDRVTLSALAQKDLPLRLGSTSDFIERRDGVAALKEMYGLNFSDYFQYNHDEIYDKLNEATIDIVDGYATDWQLEQPNYVPLEDDEGIFALYYAGPLVQQDTLPSAVTESLQRLTERIQTDDMRTLLRRAQSEISDPQSLSVSLDAQQTLRRIAGQFLVAEQLVPEDFVEVSDSDDDLQELILDQPADGAEVISRFLIYDYEPLSVAGDSAGEVQYEIQRIRNGELVPEDLGPTPLTAYRERDETVLSGGRIDWRARAVRVNGDSLEPVSEWSPYNHITYYRNRLDRICTTGELRVATAKEDGVFIADGESALAGLEIDLLQKLMESACNADITILRKAYVEWNREFFNLLTRNPTIDLLVSRISITDEREETYQLKFSDPYIEYPQSLLVLPDTNLWEDGRFTLDILAAQFETTNANLARQLLESAGVSVTEIVQTGPWADIEESTSRPLLALWRGDNTDLHELQALLNGRVQGIVADKPAIENLRRQAGRDLEIHDITDEQVAGIRNERIGFAIRTGDNELTEALNRALRENQDRFVADFQRSYQERFGAQ